jgi:streptogramin lyase
MTFTTCLRAALSGIAYAATCSYAPAAASQPGILTQPIPASHPPSLTRVERDARHRRQPHFVRYYSVPGATPFFITLGPDNDFWFTTGSQPGSIGTIAPKGARMLFPLPPSGPSVSLRIASGADGNLWATLDGGIAKITPAGNVTVYPLGPDADLGYIAAGPDGNVWFTEHDANMFGRITPGGQVTQFPFEDIGAPNGIIAGPDGKLWICEQGALNASTGHQTFGRIERVNTSGKIVATYPLPPNNWQNVPEDITVGADGKLWFTQFNAIAQVIYQISNVTTAGAVTEYNTPNSNAGPGSPILAGDGNVWFSEAYAAQLARVTPSASITEFPLPQGSAQFQPAPYGLAHNAGAGRQIWFADFQNGRIGRFVI